MPREPRYYQREARSAVTWGWEENPRQVLHLGTGAGKTFIAATIIEEMQPERVLFLADQDELCQQPLREIRLTTGILAALEKAKDQAPLVARTVVGSSQTLGKKKRRERFPRDHFDKIIIDEGHRRIEADIEIADYFETAKVVSMTATPFRHKLADLSKWYPSVAYSKPMIDLVREGFAPTPKLMTFPVEISMDGIRQAMTSDGRDFNLEDVDSKITPYYDVIAGLIKEHAKDRYGIAFLPLIKSSQAFAAVLRNHGISARHIDGQSPDRKEILQAFAEREFQWLINAGIVSTGTDLPLANAFLNLRMTRSRSWYQQARGRILRPAPGVIDHLPERHQADLRRQLIAASIKPDSLIIDILWQDSDMTIVTGADEFCTNEHDAQELFKKAKESNEAIDIMAMQAWVQQQREGNLVAALERAAIRCSMGTPMTPGQVGAILGDTEIANYEPIQGWELEPPSAAQLRMLADKLIDINSIKTKGEANKLITVLSERSKLGKATLKQVKLIKQLNEMHTSPELRTSSPENLSVVEANAIIDREFLSRRAQG